MSSFTLEASQIVLLIIDMQEKILASIDRGIEILYTISKLVRGFQLLSLPIFESEQYPQGLGYTVATLREQLGKAYRPWVKSTFSCMNDPDFCNYSISLPYQQWIVVGVEAHICVLQTVKGLLKAGKQVTVLNDAIASRSIDDFSTAIAEMRDAGARISCSEIILFELLKDSKHPQFKAISELIKSCCNAS
jgi:nicotinamidase-related amidase